MTRARNTLSSKIEIFLVHDGSDQRSATQLCNVFDDVFEPIIIRRMPQYAKEERVEGGLRLHSRESCLAKEEAKVTNLRALKRGYNART